MNEDDLYRVEGSKVWISPTARELLQALGSGRTGDIERAKYLLMRHKIRQQEQAPPPDMALPDETGETHDIEIFE